MKLSNRPSMGVPALVVAMTLVSACGGSSGSTTSQDATTASATVTPTAGGTVALPGGASVQIPANALAANTVITVRQSSAQPPTGAVSPVYEFGPSGTSFSQPITVTFPVAAGTDAASVSIYWTKAGSTDQWDSLTTTVSGTTATAQVTHFSSGFVGAFCASGAACTPANPCHTGTMTCNGTPACADLGANVTNGAACCSGGTCTDGFCAASAFEGTYVVSSMRCGGVPAKGILAAWITPPSVFEIAQTGSVGHTIFTNGNCTISQLHNVVGTWACSPSATACQAYSTAIFGSQICGSTYDDTASNHTFSDPFPACAGGSVSVIEGAGTKCSASGGGSDPLSYTLVRQ